MSALNAKSSRSDTPSTESQLSLAHVGYLRSEHAIQLRFPNGMSFEIPVRFVDELKHAQPEQLETLYLTPAKDTIALDALDAYISVSGLIRDCLRELPRSLLAKGLGAAGGSSSSEVKRSASVENGKKGGRPRKS